MEFLELAKNRRSIRRFKDEAISDEQLGRLIEAAISAPSGGNCQPWHFYVIKDDEKKHDIATKAFNQAFIATAPAVIVVCREPETSAAKYADRGRNLYSIQDTAAAVQNILLCAVSMGLGGCWCGAFDEKILSEILELPAERKPVAVVPVGVPAVTPTAPRRKGFDEIMTVVGEAKPVPSKTAERLPAFDNINLREASFNNANLKEAAFTNVNLSSAKISESNLADSKIIGCNLSSTEIIGCNLSSVKISDCSIKDLEINGVKVKTVIE